MCWWCNTILAHRGCKLCFWELHPLIEQYIDSSLHFTKVIILLHVTNCIIIVIIRCIKLLYMKIIWVMYKAKISNRIIFRIIPRTYSCNCTFIFLCVYIIFVTRINWPPNNFCKHDVILKTIKINIFVTLFEFSIKWIERYWFLSVKMILITNVKTGWTSFSYLIATLLI